MPDASRKYVIRTTLFMGGYVALNVAAITGAFDDLRPPGTWAFALAAAAPIAGHVWAVLAYMRDSDEFVGAVMARRFIVATGLSMALVSAWGLMEVYADAPHFPAIMLYPLLWAAFAVVTPFIQSTR
ncbi:MAG TPA: hypothetical protein VNQ14_10115 [Woeseiaceae bacterium]|nr:hypothetical protein [Woeseiaceae bacterium]